MNAQQDINKANPRPLLLGYNTCYSEHIWDREKQGQEAFQGLTMKASDP